jgi:hypothetical protein
MYLLTPKPEAKTEEEPGRFPKTRCPLWNSVQIAGDLTKRIDQRVAQGLDGQYHRQNHDYYPNPIFDKDVALFLFQ